MQADRSSCCYLCNSRDVRELWHATDKKFRGPGKFTYWRCSRCGLLVLHPRPTDEALSQYYPDYVTPVQPSSSFRQRLKRMVAEDWYGYGADRAAFIGLLRKAVTFPLRRLLHQVPRKRQGGRVLDIGCGSGGYLAFLANLGWTSYGVEPGPNSRGYAQRELGLTVHQGQLAACNFPDQWFDVVTMWHTIEHVPDPLSVLREIRRILKPDGAVMLSTPNIDCADAVFFQDCWYALDAPRHCFLFSSRTIRLLLEQSGFTISRLWYQYHPTVPARSLLYWLEEGGMTRTRNTLVRWSRSLELGMAISTPLRRLLGQGDTIYLEARMSPSEAGA
ncbi:MAG: class I SAM-dependent methyltransferase [Nitrospirae bacterium]|nr:MAG: class I SAM-dependent methyltransferase [Nitrospirota bacterium]